MGIAGRQSWTAEEDAILVTQYPSNGVEIPELVGRTADSIRKRARKLGIAKDLNIWTVEEERLLRENYDSCGADIPGLNRTQSAIQAKALKLGLQKRVEARWTAAEVDILKDAYSRGVIPEFDRHSLSAVKSKAQSLGLVGNRRWSEQDLSILIDNYLEQGPKGVVKLLPHRTYDQIVAKAERLGLSSGRSFKDRSLDVDKVRAAFGDFIYCTCAVCGKVFLVRGNDYKTFSHRTHTLSVPDGWHLRV